MVLAAVIDLSGSSSIPKADISGAQLRILPVVVDGTDERELGTLVPVKASAGYLSGYGDADYIGALPRFSMPFPELPQDRSSPVYLECNTNFIFTEVDPMNRN